MGTSSVCFDMFIIDDEENDLNEYLYFNLYFYNGSLTQLIDRFEIEVFDNEKGQLIIIRESFKHETYAIHVCKFIDCTMLTVLHLCFNHLDITMGQCLFHLTVILWCSCLCWV